MSSDTNPSNKPSTTVEQPAPLPPVIKAPTTVGRPSPLSPPAPNPGDAKADRVNQVFLSPRVLDESAYKAYSAELRQLLQDAADRAEQARTTTLTATELASEITAAQQKQRATLELNTKLYKAIVAKGEEINEAQARLEQRASAIAEAEAKIDRLIQDRLVRFDSHLQTRLTSAEQDLIAHATTTKDAVNSTTNSAMTQLSGRAQELQIALEEDLQRGHNAAISNLETIRNKLAEQITAFDDATQGKVESARDGLIAILERIDASRAELNERLAATSDKGLAKLETLCDRATKLLGGEPGATPTQGSLGDIVAQASKTREDAEWSIRRLATIRDDADTSVQELDASIGQAMELFEALIARKQELTQGIHKTLELATKTEDTLAERCTEASTLLEPLCNAHTDAQRTASHLNDIVTEARSLSGNASDAAIRLEALLEAGTKLARALAAWEPIILDHSESAALPPALQEVVNKFQRDIGADLHKMAAAMNMIANRAQTTVRPAAKAGEAPEVVIRMREVADNPSALPAETDAA